MKLLLKLFLMIVTISLAFLLTSCNGYGIFVDRTGINIGKVTYIEHK